MDDLILAVLKKFVHEYCQGQAIVEVQNLDKFDDYELMIEEVPEKEDSTRFIMVLSVIHKDDYKKLSSPDQRTDFVI